jgi:hypothetical protein
MSDLEADRRIVAQFLADNAMVAINAEALRAMERVVHSLHPDASRPMLVQVTPETLAALADYERVVKK